MRGTSKQSFQSLDMHTDICEGGQRCVAVDSPADGPWHQAWPSLSSPWRPNLNLFLPPLPSSAHRKIESCMKDIMSHKDKN